MFYFVGVISISYFIRRLDNVLVRVDNSRDDRIRSKLDLYGDFVFRRLVNGLEDYETIKSFLCQEKLRRSI